MGFNILLLCHIVCFLLLLFFDFFSEGEKNQTSPHNIAFSPRSWACRNDKLWLIWIVGLSVFSLHDVWRFLWEIRGLLLFLQRQWFLTIFLCNYRKVCKFLCIKMKLSILPQINIFKCHQMTLYWFLQLMRDYFFLYIRQS